MEPRALMEQIASLDESVQTALTLFLKVIADLKWLCILDGEHLIAKHRRSCDKGQEIEDESHINALWLQNPTPSNTCGQDCLSAVLDQVHLFLQQTIERGHGLKTTVTFHSIICWMTMAGTNGTARSRKRSNSNHPTRKQSNKSWNAGAMKNSNRRPWPSR